MAYSSQPGTATLYYTGNSGNTAYPRFTQVLGYDTTPQEYRGDGQKTTIGAILNQMGYLPWPGETSNRDSMCAMLLKGFFFSDPCVQTYHTTYAFAEMMAHDESNQNGATEAGAIVSNGLLVVPKVNQIQIFDAIEYIDVNAGPATTTYYYVSDIECDAVQFVRVNGYHGNDDNIATIPGGSSTFAQGYKHFGSSYKQQNYQNISVKILFAEIKCNTSIYSQFKFDPLQLTRAKLEVTVDDVVHYVDVVNDPTDIDFFETCFVRSVGATHYISGHTCTYRMYDGSQWYDLQVDNTATISRSDADLAAAGRHESDLRGAPGNQVITMFTIANMAVGVYSSDNHSDEIKIQTADKWYIVQTDDSVDCDVTEINPNTFSISNSVPYRFEDEDDFEDARTEIYDNVVIHSDHFIDYTDVKQFEFSNNKYADNKREFTFEAETYITGEVESVGGIGYVDGVKDALLGTYDMTSPILTSLNQTPMDYYSGARNSGRVEFDEQLSNDSDAASEDESEPTYFWVETLKNWCYYSLKEIDEACNIAVLNVWNGMDGWLQLDSIIERTKKDFATKKRAELLIDTYNQNPEAYAYLKPVLDRLVKLMTSALLIYPFRTENLKTVAVDRFFIPKVKPDYQGHKEHHWYDGVIEVAKSLGSNMVDYWKGVWDIITSPVYIFYGDETMFDKLVSGWKQFGAGLAGMMVDTFKLTVGFTGGIFVQELYHYFFSDSPADPFSQLDHYNTLYALCRYVELPYDTGYSSNDKRTYQTIRTPKRVGVAGGIYNRTPIIPCIVIPSTIGSPFVFRSSTGELMLAYDFSYSGPVSEGYAADTDFKKMPGVVQDDVDLTNRILQEQFGKGDDKVIEDWLNTTGNTPDIAATKLDASNFIARLATGKVEQMTAVQKATGTMTLNANRSKTSADTDSAIINTVTKW